MKRITLGLVALALGALAIAPAQAAAPKLVGTVGPGFTIKLTSGGKKVTKLKAGKYTFVIADKSVDSQLRPRAGVRWQVGEAAHLRAVRREENGDRDAQEGQVEVLLRAARELDVRVLHR